jgi:hypothetical protein
MWNSLSKVFTKVRLFKLEVLKETRKESKFILGSDKYNWMISYMQLSRGYQKSILSVII